MAMLRIIQTLLKDLLKDLLAAIRAHRARRRAHAELRGCDERTLKDIGLRWERGRLVPLNPEDARAPPSGRRATAPRKAPATCPCCGARLIQARHAEPSSEDRGQARFR